MIYVTAGRWLVFIHLMLMFILRYQRLVLDSTGLAESIESVFASFPITLR